MAEAYGRSGETTSGSLYEFSPAQVRAATRKFSRDALINDDGVCATYRGWLASAGGEQRPVLVLRQRNGASSASCGWDDSQLLRELTEAAAAAPHERLLGVLGTVRRLGRRAPFTPISR